MGRYGSGEDLVFSLQSFFEINEMRKKSSAFAFDCFSLVCLPQLQFYCYKNKAGPLT